jgi:SAM-dependent methyltransferase
VSSKADEAASYEYEVAQVFDRLAERFSVGHVEHACALAAVHPGEQVLDVGTGTGIMARAIGARLGGSGKVLGVDLARGMLQVAEERGRKLGLTPHIVRFQLGDAEGLDLPDGSVDLVTSLFVLHHLPSPQKALAEMARVLRPGGRVVLGVGSAAPRRSLRGARYRAIRLRSLVRRQLGLSLSAPAFLLRLLDRRLPDDGGLRGTEQRDRLTWRPAHALTRLLREEGFQEIRRSWGGAVERIEDPELFWELQVHFTSRARYRLLGARPEVVESLRLEFLRECNEVLDRGGELVYPHGAAFVTGRLAR